MLFTVGRSAPRAGCATTRAGLILLTLEYVRAMVVPVPETMSVPPRPTVITVLGLALTSLAGLLTSFVLVWSVLGHENPHAPAPLEALGWATMPGVIGAAIVVASSRQLQRPRIWLQLVACFPACVLLTVLVSALSGSGPGRVAALGLVLLFLAMLLNRLAAALR